VGFKKLPSKGELDGVSRELQSVDEFAVEDGGEVVVMEASDNKASDTFESQDESKMEESSDCVVLESEQESRIFTQSEAPPMEVPIAFSSLRTSEACEQNIHA
jgi:hypothetical protein